MAEYLRIGEVAQAVGVSVDTLRRWERDGRVTFSRRGNQRFLEAAELADLLRERGVSTHSSARNRMSGVVLSVKRDGVMAQVDMACGPFRVTAAVTRDAIEELGLAEGVPATATVKATSVMVEGA